MENPLDKLETLVELRLVVKTIRAAVAIANDLDTQNVYELVKTAKQ
jgi:hypothetical protein